jgi:hypothetical protein
MLRKLIIGFTPIAEAGIKGLGYLKYIFSLEAIEGSLLQRRVAEYNSYPWEYQCNM